tara:strand:+ start:77 stop:487 length:411 start_codon:yes stop_codon:yes gene_type:complete
MKKLLFTTITIFTTLIASAQFSVMTSLTMPEEGDQFEMSNITDNMGIGYQINDKMMAGLVKNGENYDVFGRYYFENIYVSLQMPTEEMSENMNMGVGYSYNVWDKLYIEPNYSIPMKEDESGEREGKFLIGLSYKL